MMIRKQIGLKVLTLGRKRCVMENQRVRITKMLLKNSLIKILHEKKIEKVTVSELCEDAGINRSTFYKHYGSQFDVYSEIEQDFFKAAIEMITFEKEGGKTGICRFLEFLKERKEEVYVVIVLQANEDFIQRVFDIPALRYFANENYDARFTERQNEYMRIYEYNGGFALIREWVASGCVEEPAQIEELLLHLSDYGKS